MSRAGGRFCSSWAKVSLEGRKSPRVPLLFSPTTGPVRVPIWPALAKRSPPQPTRPPIGATAALPGKTALARAASSSRRWSLSKPFSTARRSVVGSRSRPSCRSAGLRPGQSAITRPPLSAPPASSATVPVPWSVPSVPLMRAVRRIRQRSLPPSRAKPRPCWSRSPPARHRAHQASWRADRQPHPH